MHLTSLVHCLIHNYTSHVVGMLHNTGINSPITKSRSTHPETTLTCTVLTTLSRIPSHCCLWSLKMVSKVHSDVGSVLLLSFVFSFTNRPSVGTRWGIPFTIGYATPRSSHMSSLASGSCLEGEIFSIRRKKLFSWPPTLLPTHTQTLTHTHTHKHTHTHTHTGAHTHKTRFMVYS